MFGRSDSAASIEPSIVCGKCEFCQNGRPNNCVASIFMGGLQAPGFFREYANVPARNAEHFPVDMDYITASLIEPTAVVVHVFDPETRAYYALEELWADAPQVAWK